LCTDLTAPWAAARSAEAAAWFLGEEAVGYMPSRGVRWESGLEPPPHLVGGNPLAMRWQSALIEGEESRLRAFALSFSGLERHPHVCKVRTADGNVDLARELLRATARALPAGKPVTSPVRSYEEHVARALLAEGFREFATSMLFTKELAERVEERVFAPAGVR